MLKQRPHVQYVEYANFVCKFGENLDLLDLVEEVIIPAFFDRGLSRPSRRNRYFLHRVEIVEVQTQPQVVLALSGRLVKETSYVSEQKYNRSTDDIETSDDEIESAPSSFFLLTLNDHRLAYMPETGNAPSLKAFETTIKGFIKVKHETFVQEEFDQAHQKRKEDPSFPRITKKELNAQYPPPIVNVVPLSTADAVTEYLAKFRLIKSVDFQLITPNADEIDGLGFFTDLHAEKSEFNASEANLHLGNPQEGLNADVTEKRIAEAIATGNTKVKFVGEGQSGEKIEGDETEVRVREVFPIDTRGPVVSVVTVAKQMWDKLVDALKGGRIELAAQTADPIKVNDKIDVIRRQQIELNEQSRRAVIQPSASASQNADPDGPAAEEKVAAAGADAENI